MIWEVQESLDGNTLAANARGREIHIVETRTGKDLLTLEGPKDAMYSLLRLSSNGQVVVARESDPLDIKDEKPCDVCVWRVNSGKLLHRLRGAPGMTSLDVSADGRVVTTVASRGRNGGVANVWEVDTGRVARTFPVEARATPRSALSPDGRIFACWDSAGDPLPGDKTGSGGCVVDLFDVATGRRLTRLRSAERWIDNARFSPDGKTIAVGGRHGALQVFDVAAHKEVLRSDAPSRDGAQEAGSAEGAEGVDPSCRIAYSRDGKMLASGTAKGINLHDVATGTRTRHFQAPPWRYFSLGFRNDRVFAFTSIQQSIQLWDVSANRALTPAGGHIGTLCSVAFAADREKIVSTGFDGYLCVWDAATGRLSSRAKLIRQEDYTQDPEDFYIPLPLGPGGRLALRVGEVSPQRVVDVASGRVVHELKGYVPSPCWLLGVGFSTDGRMAAFGTLTIHGQEDQVCVWDLGSGRSLGTFGPFRSSNGRGVAVALSKEAGRVAVLGQTENTNKGNAQIAEVTVFELATGAKVARFLLGLAPINELSFSPDGGTIAVVEGQGVVTVRATTTGGIIRTFAEKGDWYPTKLLFSPDGRSLAVAGTEEASGRTEIRVMELASGKVRAQFDGPAGAITCLSWSLDEKKLASGSTDTAALIWDLTGQEIDHRRVTKGHQAEPLWEDLASSDATAAYGAMWRLELFPEEAVRLLQVKVRPADKKLPDVGELRRLVRELDNTRFDVRESAMRELREAGKPAGAVLRSALTAGPSPEKRRRIEELLSGFENYVLTREELRQVRAIELLERMNTPESRQLLGAVSRGSEDALITKEAKASLRRMTGTSR